MSTWLRCAPPTLIYRLEPLNEEHAIGLLLVKMRKRRGDMESDEKLKTIVKRLVQKCGYLPLAILTIGSLFATIHELDWEKLYIQLPSELETNLNLEAIRRIVTLSYNYLPFHLKPCFLYLSIFPEDFEIKRTRLVHRWIAEGFIIPRVGMTLEDVVESYFNELISRSMIQSAKVNLEGIVKSCRVHDIIRDIVVSLSRTKSFVTTSSDNASSLQKDNFRHVAYHVGKCSMIGMDWKRVRSLTVFGERPVEYGPSNCLHQLRMIRVVDFENADFRITQKDIRNIGLLHHLKYVNIFSSFPDFSNIYALPRSIGKLQGLQVLDIRGSHVSSLPTEICKLQSLRSLRSGSLTTSVWLALMKFRHLAGSQGCNMIDELQHMPYSSSWPKKSCVKVPRGIGNLKELRTLESVDIKRTSSKAIIELGELSKLRKIRVNTERVKRKKCLTLCKAMQMLTSLCSLRIIGGYYDATIEWLDSVPTLPSLRSLNLHGRCKVDCLRNHTQLVKLCLWFSNLEEGKVMEILGALPCLRLLELYGDAYVGEVLLISGGSFPNLRTLCIGHLDQLREIRIDHGGLPHMENIEIAVCRLELGINGIKHLPKIKKIAFNYGIKVARLGMLQDYMNTHPNRPVLQLTFDRSYHDLGNPERSDEYFDAVESLPDHDGDGDDSEATTLAATDS